METKQERNCGNCGIADHCGSKTNLNKSCFAWEEKYEPMLMGEREPKQSPVDPMNSKPKFTCSKCGKEVDKFYYSCPICKDCIDKPKESVATVVKINDHNCATCGFRFTPDCLSEATADNYCCGEWIPKHMVDKKENNVEGESVITILTEIECEAIGSRAGVDRDLISSVDAVNRMSRVKKEAKSRIRSLIAKEERRRVVEELINCAFVSWKYDTDKMDYVPGGAVVSLAKIKEICEKL